MFRDYGVHLHVPAGAIPKDGPSAGVAITAALASLYSGRRVRPDTSMTGEITLSGLVFPVGGIKEKVLAAHRAGIHRIILPARNEADLEEIPEDVRAELNIKLITRINEIVDVALEKFVANPPPPVPPELTQRPPLEPDPRTQPLIAKER
jgi:ATP-dependent Lon protease